MATLTNQTKQHSAFENLLVAKSFWARSKGLIGTNFLGTDTAMLIPRCNWIHTFFMRFPIDAVYVDRDLKVKMIQRNVSPGRLAAPAWGAQSVIEMTAGMAEKLNFEIGDQLHVGD